MLTPSDRVLTRKEAATYLQLSYASVSRLTDRQVLPGVKIGGSWRLRQGDLDAMIYEGLPPLRPPPPGWVRLYANGVRQTMPLAQCLALVTAEHG